MTSERIQRRIESQLDEADAALVEGDWSTVLDRSQKALHLNPTNSDALTFSAGRRGTGTWDSPTEPVALGQAVQTPPESLTVPAATPTVFAKGRYQVKEFLGEGGRKRVYQAHDTVLNRDVALAIIQTEGLDPTSRVRMTR